MSLAPTSSLTSDCRLQAIRTAASLSGFSWVLFPLLIWYKWLPPLSCFRRNRGTLSWAFDVAMSRLRNLSWALILGADCWWISTGGYNSHVQEVLVAQIACQLLGWMHHWRFEWELALNSKGEGWPGNNDRLGNIYWDLCNNGPFTHYDSDSLTKEYIERECSALMDETYIRAYFPGILDPRALDENSTPERKQLRDAMVKVQAHFRPSSESMQRLEQLYVAFGSSAAAAIKTAPGFKTLKLNLIMEFVQIDWSLTGITLTFLYISLGVGLVGTHDKDAALQWFRSALGSGMLVILQRSAKTASHRTRIFRMLTVIFLSIGAHLALAILNPLTNWYLQWRGVMWCSLWITWLLPLLEFKIRREHGYMTTVVAFLTFGSRVLDALLGIYVSLSSDSV